MSKQKKELRKVPELDIIPLKERIILQPELTEAKTAGGIIIPDTARKKTNKALVVSVGDLSNNIKDIVVPGCTVLYDITQATELNVAGVTYYLIHEDSALVVL